MMPNWTDESNTAKNAKIHKLLTRRNVAIKKIRDYQKENGFPTHEEARRAFEIECNNYVNRKDEDEITLYRFNKYKFISDKK